MGSKDDVPVVQIGDPLVEEEFGKGEEFCLDPKILFLVVFYQEFLR